jgi:hypothetical protein
VPDLPFAVAVIPVKGLTGADQIEDNRAALPARPDSCDSDCGGKQFGIDV